METILTVILGALFVIGAGALFFGIRTLRKQKAADTAAKLAGGGGGPKPVK